MEIDRKNILDIVNKCNLKPDKDYGQNFLIDSFISKKIVDSLEIKPNEYVLEIGPGLGSLTHFLAAQASKLDVIEIDKRMVDFLKIEYSNKENVNLINQDIRNCDVSNYNKIVANLPYNLTTEIIVYLLSNVRKCDEMVLMCQSETLQHFTSLSGKEYGPTSIFIHLLGKIERLFNVKPGQFYPAPKCNSSVFKISLNKNENILEIIEIYKMSKELFKNRRKTILNNLNSLLKNTEQSENILKKTNIQANKRPEEISFETYRLIYKQIKNK